MDKRNPNSHLVLLTAGFPFGSGETFIENELPYLGLDFDKISIISPDLKGDLKIRDLPDNVMVFKYQIRGNFYYRIISLFNADFWAGLRLDLERKDCKVNVINKFRVCWYSFSKGLLIKKAIIKLLNLNREAFTSMIFYSYWFDESALALSLINKQQPMVTCIARAHGWDVFEERHDPPFLPFRPWLLKNLDKVFLVSEKGKNYLAEKFDQNLKKLEVSYLGTKELNRGNKFKKETFYIVSCGSLIPLKRIDLVIDSLAMLDSPVLWHHIGNGPLRENLELKAKTILKGGVVEFQFLGQLQNKDVKIYFESIEVDLFISLSESEGLPVSMMEAQSAGTPILATNVGGVNEIVVDGYNGWLLPENPSKKEVKEKILEITNLDASKKLDIRNNALNHWTENFNAYRNYPNFIQKLKGLNLS